MDDQDLYTCALSGLTAPPAPEAEGDLEDLPVGWARVTVEVRQDNPAWLRIQQGKAALIAQQLAVAADASDPGTLGMAELLADATFAALEASVPRYITLGHEVSVSPDHLPTVTDLLDMEEE